MFPCFGKAKFQFCEFFVLKIGPDWGIFSRANIGGKDSLRHELPHTRNPGLVRATVLPGDSFWCEASKQPRDRCPAFFLTFFSTLFVTVLVQYNSFDSSVTQKRSFLLLHSIVSTST